MALKWELHGDMMSDVIRKDCHTFIFNLKSTHSPLVGEAKCSFIMPDVEYISSRTSSVSKRWFRFSSSAS